jgi:hypothetical protein
VPVLRDFRYDRRVPEDFGALFGPAGVLHDLVRYALRAQFPVDLQFRGDYKSQRRSASLYVGLNAVLNIAWSVKKGTFQLGADKEFANERNSWREELAGPHAPSDFAPMLPNLRDYLDLVIPAAAGRRGFEGAVQAAISHGSGNGIAMLDREAMVSFRNNPIKSKTLEGINAEWRPLLADMAGVPKSFGGKSDLLAIQDGQLLTVEVKPRGVGSIVWAPAQAVMYALLFGLWLSDDPEATSILNEQLHLRQKLGLISDDVNDLVPGAAVTPVLAVQRGMPAAIRTRMLEVRARMADAGLPEAQRLRIHEANLIGDLSKEL